MSNHTSGPWFVRHCDDERSMCMTVISTKDYGPNNIGQFDGEPDTIAIVYHQCQPFVSGGFEIDDCDERDANAALIAAAPDLLAALQAVVSVADRKTDEFDLAHAAITKATGGAA